MHVVLVILLLLVLPVSALAVVLTLPRWFPRRVAQDRVWRLRDKFVDDIILHKRLPNDHPAVMQLVREMDAALRTAKHITLLDIWLNDRLILRRLDARTLRALKKQATPCPLTGLNKGQRQLMKDYRTAYKTLFVGSLMLGSWFGVFIVLRTLPQFLAYRRKVANTPRLPEEEGLPQQDWRVVPERRVHAQPVREVSLRRLELQVREGALGVREAGLGATDQAATNSKIGQWMAKSLQLLKALPRIYEPEPRLALGRGLRRV